MNADKLRKFIVQVVSPFKILINTMVTRAVIAAVNDSKKMQVVKVKMLAGETRADVERFQNFGFSSNPPVGSECIALAIGANRDHLVIINTDDRNTRQKEIDAGDAIVYDAGGNKLHFKNGGNVEITALTGLVKTITGDETITAENIKATLAENFELELSKVKIENDTAELIDELQKAFAALSVEPMLVNKALYADAATKILSFKVT